LSKRLWRIAVTVPDEQKADAIAGLLDTVVTALTAYENAPDGDWLVQGFLMDKPDAAALSAGLALAAQALEFPEPELIVEPVEDIDWLRLNQESFPPMRIGGFYIYGSHVTERKPAGMIPLRIDAATAFGTGEHATTSGCLRAFTRIAKQGRRRRILDMGTGTGILAIAAAKTWHLKVRACDIDPHSVDVACENVAINGVSSLIQPFVSNGYRAPAVRSGAPYDLIFANILARPLTKMAPDLARHLAPGGIAILSGLLLNQERMVLNAHRAQGLHFYQRIVRGNWDTLILMKR